MQWFNADPNALIFASLSALGIFGVLVLLTRISGVRSFSKMSSFDFAITVAIGSLIASVVLSKQPSLLLGATALAVLFVIQIGVAALRVAFPSIQRLFDNSPRLIMVGDRMLDDQMRKAKITKSDLRGKLREANVLDFSQIEAVVAEPTGDVSVLHRGPDGPRLNPALLEGVTGKENFDRYMNG